MWTGRSHHDQNATVAAANRSSSARNARHSRDDMTGTVVALDTCAGDASMPQLSVRHQADRQIQISRRARGREQLCQDREVSPVGDVELPTCRRGQSWPWPCAWLTGILGAACEASFL